MNDNVQGNRNDKKPARAEGSMMGVGIAIGMALGVALGSAMGNIGTGIAMGLALGVAIGAAMEGNEQRGRPERNKRLTWLLSLGLLAVGAMVLVAIVALA